MRHIRLADGSVYEVDRCGADDKQLNLRVISAERLVDLCVKFGDPEKTKSIEHWFDDTETDHVWYYGYTYLAAAAVSDGGKNFYLRKDDN